MELSNTYIVTKINKPSSSPAFQGLKEGDAVYFSIPIKSVGMSRNRSHAAYIECMNLQTYKISMLSFNQIEKVLANFEWGFEVESGGAELC